MIYTIEIVGLLTVEADSKEEAIEIAKQQFEDENLTYEDLDFTCDDDE